MILFNLFDSHPLACTMAEKLSAKIGSITIRNFPDGETYCRFETEIKNQELIFLESLNQPNTKILPLLFAAHTARTIGAKKIGLCAPYLAYMRQDKQFHPGEAITSDYFAALLSRYFDWIVTVDPHLHRHHELNEIYKIPNTVVHAAPVIAQWIAQHIENPVLIGPDRESEQWVSEVAKQAHAPYFVLDKIRHGDREVEISMPDIHSFLNHTPVLVDDIISTARTMIETVKQLKQVNMKKPICIGVHGIFADHSDQALLQAGAEKIITCNTIVHSSNQIDLSDVMVKGIFMNNANNK